MGVAFLPLFPHCEGLILTGSLVSDAVAGELLRNPSMVSFLRKYGALKLEKGMTEEQNRLAIQQAVERAVHKESPAPEEDPKTVQTLPEGQKSAGEPSLRKDKGSSTIKGSEKYWKPKLKSAEWKLLHYKMKSAGKPLDDATYWVYATEKGTSIFAIYGVGDGTENTPLYASGGETAVRDGELTKKFVEGMEHGTYGSAETLDGLLEKFRREHGRGTSYFLDGTKRPGADSGDVQVSFRTPGCTGERPVKQGQGDLRLDGGAGNGGLRGQERKTGELLPLPTAVAEPSQTGSPVSDKMADNLLRDQSSVSFLTRKGGLKLNKKMSQEQKRAAVRQAVKRIINRDAGSRDAKAPLDPGDTKLAGKAELGKSDISSVTRIVERIARSDTKQNKLIGGALDPESERADAHAERYYEFVRKMTTDVKRIAENTGIPEAVIQRIKNFIFMDVHDLGEGEIARFDPIYEMAESWQRLIDGKNIQPHDLTLLRHEIMENELMDQGYSQDEAHILASKKYDYKKESEEYHGSVKKNKKRQ